MPQIGRFLLNRELGRGPIGIVYEAIDPVIGRAVAIKTIQLQAFAGETKEEVLLERLQREAQSAGALSHPGIVIIFDVGRQEHTFYIAMERVEGPSLHEYLNSKRRLDPARAIELLKQIAGALDYAHENGVVHRDVKPANVMLHKGSMVKVADFGINTITSAQAQTGAGSAVSKRSYMSPEQLKGKALDGRSDQFSLAAIAYEMLTGAEPYLYTDWTPEQTPGKPPSASAANPALPPAIDEVLFRGMARPPEDRFGSCTEFVEALAVACKSEGGAQAAAASAPAPAPVAAKPIAPAPVPAPILAPVIEKAASEPEPPAAVETKAETEKTPAAPAPVAAAVAAAPEPAPVWGSTLFAAQPVYEAPQQAGKTSRGKQIGVMLLVAAILVGLFYALVYFSQKPS